MPLYHITGISGAGKSTVLAELRHRKYEAYDVDEVGPVTAKWHNNRTGYIHPKSSVKAADRTPEFIAEHSWIVPREEIAALAEQAGNSLVFMGGAISNESEIRELVAVVFALAIDNDTLVHRLHTRKNNDWGKSMHELEHSRALNDELVDRYKSLGYTVIDASQSPGVIADEILRIANENK